MSIFSSLLKKPLAVIENKIASAKHDAQLEMSAIIAKLLVLVTVAFFILLAVMLASVGLALFINFSIGHPFYGYLWVGGSYFLIAVLLIVLNKTGAIKKVLSSYSNRIVFGKLYKE